MFNHKTAFSSLQQIKLKYIKLGGRKVAICTQIGTVPLKHLTLQALLVPEFRTSLPSLLFFDMAKLRTPFGNGKCTIFRGIRSLFTGTINEVIYTLDGTDTQTASGWGGAVVRRLRAAAGTRTGETVEPQSWEEGRTFPGGFTIDDKGPAMETAQNWRRTGTVWTDGSRLDSGAVGAACAWQTEEGWTGRRFHLGTNKEVFDAEVYAIYQALRVFEERGQAGRKYTAFSGCQPAIRRALSDALRPGQQWARAIIEVATRLIDRGNEVLLLWAPAHVGVEGNEVADGMAKEAAAGRMYGVPDRVRWQASLPHCPGGPPNDDRRTPPGG